MKSTALGLDINQNA